MNRDGPPAIGIVLIGRNEGERLVRSLASIPGGIVRRVYVDSGSTDGSIAAAERAGAQVVVLDPGQPFTAARARNVGFAALIDNAPVEFVQFIDGDCELHPQWIDTASAFLKGNPHVAAVCGRRRERFPEASVYNRLCDWEWNTPIGRATACGGDAMMRAEALQAVGGFNPALIAGEEPELCVRLRQSGWEIWRLDAEMTLHDAAMTRFGQWWKRSRRAGYAAAEGMALHGRPPERHGVAATQRAVAWGIVIPLLAVAGSALSPWLLLLLLVYPVQFFRLARRYRGDGAVRWERAAAMVIGKFAEGLGVMEYWGRRAMKRPAHLIEYK